MEMGAIGLASLELLKLVTKDDGSEKWVPPGLPDSFAIGWFEFNEPIPIKFCNAIVKEKFPP